MAIESNIVPPTNIWFAGDKKVLSFEIFGPGAVFNDRGEYVSGTMKSVAGLAMRWSMRKAVRPLDPHRQRSEEELAVCTSAGGSIAVVGVYNSVRAVNTERVEVTVPASGTKDLTGGKYVHALKDIPDDAVLSFGTVELFVASTA